VKSGVYEILNNKSGKKYVGSSVNIEKRWGDHLSYLRSGNHINKHLQSSYDKYGEASFSFEILELVKNGFEKKREQWYLDNYVVFGVDYNIATSAFSGMSGRNHSKESRHKMSEALEGENSPNWGKHHSEETKKKLSMSKIGEKNPASKLSDEDVLEARMIFSESRSSMEELGVAFGVNRRTMYDIIHGKTYSHLPSLPVKGMRLKKNDVIKMRELHRTGKYSNMTLGKMFNVSRSNVGLIVRNKTWRDIS